MRRPTSRSRSASTACIAETIMTHVGVNQGGDAAAKAADEAAWALIQSHQKK